MRAINNILDNLKNMVIFDILDNALCVFKNRLDYIWGLIFELRIILSWQ